MAQHRLFGVTANDELRHRVSFVLEALERRSLFSAAASLVAAKLPSPSSTPHQSEEAASASVKESTRAQATTDDDEADSDSESESATTKNSATASHQSQVIGAADDDSAGERETEKSEGVESASSPGPSNSDAQNSGSEHSSSEHSATPSSQGNTGSDQTTESITPPANDTKAATEVNAASETTNQTPFSSQVVSSESAAVSADSGDVAATRSLNLPLATLSGLGTDIGIPIGATANVAQLVHGNVARAEFVIGQVFSSLPIVTSSIAPLGKVLNSLGNGNTAEGFATRTIRALPQLAATPVMRHFARLGNPMLLLNDSLASFADESVIGTTTPLTSRIRNAWIVTTLVLAADIVLLFQFRKALSPRKTKS